MGLPRVGTSKSGVSGGICAVVPGSGNWNLFSVFDSRDDSVRGLKVCEVLSNRFGLHAFEVGFSEERLEVQFRLRNR